MEQITLYTKPGCPFCKMTRELLQQKEIDFIEYSLSDQEQREQQKEKTGQQTFPQIFIGEKLVGGYDELKELNENDKLK